MESDDKIAKETTRGHLIKPLLGCTVYTTPQCFSHIYAMSIKQASQANWLTHTFTLAKWMIRQKAPKHFKYKKSGFIMKLFHLFLLFLAPHHLGNLK